MPATSSGRIVKSRKGKTSTPHQKNHRWESFSAKISKLHSLDPLRKVRRHDLDAEDFESTTSYFKNGLDKWADLDVSKGFISFKREVSALCDSLAQIIHFEGKIMDLLEKYISAQEKESLESLLDLLTAFAHDLGTRFEKHYPRALALITQIASKRHGADVIEWTFACLAFLFKYLSRLLVPDIRPTYDAVAPLLGKARNPQYIARFAAEAMSFLVKKAAAPSHKEKSLPLLIEHARKDLQALRGDKQYELYHDGLMTMFAEAIKGQGNGVHTTAPAIVQALIASVPEDECCSADTETWAEVVCGTLVSSVHHTTPETFEPIAQAIYDRPESESTDHAILDLRLLGVMSGVRMGSRISNWQDLLDFQCKRLDSVFNHQSVLEALEPSAIWDHIIVNIAIVWAYASFDAVTPHITDLVKILTSESLKIWFISFCSYLSDLDASKFRSLFLAHFQKFVGSHWAEDANQDMLYVLLPRMVQSRALPSPRDSKPFVLPQTWQDDIIETFGKLEATPFPEAGSKACDEDTNVWRNKCLPKYAAILRLLEYINVDTKTVEFITDRLSTKLKLALRPSESLETEEARFIAGQGFSSYIKMSRAIGQLDQSLGPLLRAAAPRYSRLTGYLEAMLAYEAQISISSSTSANGSVSPEKEESPLLKCLISNLSSASSDLRTASLRLLSNMESAPDQLDALSIMLQTEQTSLDLQNARAISVHLRRLGAIYSKLDETTWLRQAVPAYLFGVLTVRLMPVWETAVEALKQVSQSQSGEDAVCEKAFEWIQAPSKRWDGSSREAPIFSSRQGATDFECINLNQLRDRADEAKRVTIEASDILLHGFEESQQLVDERPMNARSQAIKVLSAAPNLAEKRSRVLVPIFLSWATSGDAQIESLEDEPNSDETDFWSLTDRKALLGVFAQFNNSKVLFQSQQVYDALLKQLANGDIEIQKSALKALLSWKLEGLKPYRENLEFLLDEARFKDELTTLFQGDNRIQAKHHAEVMPVLLRLLYGRTISKKGVSSGRDGLQATRLAVLRNLSVEDMGGFLDVALGELRGVEVINENGTLRTDVVDRELLTVRKQFGFLNMILSMINELGTGVVNYTSTILPAVLYCLINACRRLDQSNGELDKDEAGGHISLLRNVRTTGLKCIVALLQNAQKFNWTPYADVLIKEVVTPRLENLPTENTEGVSGTLQLLSTFSSLPNTALFLGIDDRIIPKLTDLLSHTKAKDDVKIFSLSVVRNLVALAQAPAVESEFNELIKEELLDPNLDMILGKISHLLRSQERSENEPGKELGKDLLAACIETVVELSPLVQQSGNTAELIDISVYLLNQPPRRVHPRVKGGVLTILENFLQLADAPSDQELRNRIYTTISSLYNFFKDKPSREALSRVLAVFISKEPDIKDEVASLCSQLNSHVEARMDEVNYDVRLAAYNTIAKASFTAQEWLPLLQNLLFYIKHDEEYGVLSTNSADGICRFADAASSATGPEKDKFFEMLQDLVIPAVYSGAREASETVRRETVRVMGYFVSHLPSWSAVSDLVTLDPPADEDDSESSFFDHIMSSAASRQMRALQFLSKVNNAKELGSRNLAHFLIPLLEHFLYGREDGEDDHGVGAQASTTIADLAISLEWPQFRAILVRYIGYVQSKPDHQKQLVRLLGKLIDTLAVSGSQKYPPKLDADDMVEDTTPEVKLRLTATMPALEKFSDDIVKNVIPPLMVYIHHKDETTVSSRVPVGVIIVRLLKVLPFEILEQKLPGVLTDICQILRSKAWDAREMARDTLAKITSLLGPTAFGFVLDELRGALTKGYQLHVLSYTMHTILVQVIPEFQPGDLDYCLDKIVAVIMDDIFGAVGLEKDAEEYISKMKEVKSSKSQDSMELIARTASISHLVALVRPLQSLLLEKLDLRMVRKIDDLLNRITNGLLGNASAESRDTLIFCYEVIQKVYESEKPKADIRMDPKIRRYLIQKGAKKSGERGTTNKYTHKLVRFSFDILRSVFRKHDSLRNASNISGFIPIFGDAIVGGEEEVKIATFKLLTVLAKVPFKTDESTKLYKVAAKDAIKSISISTTTTNDLAQSALKLVSVVLRDRRDVPVKDAAVDMLLGKLKDDLTEPLYRHVTFNFLRAILDRKVETASVYDSLDYVGSVMITNDDKDTRDLARGAFFQFLRDYPQKKNRWAKQLSFVVANLKYDREGGRLSVMEVVHLLLMKSAQDFVQEVATTCFIPLFFVLANDDSEKCRLAAGELLKEIFRKADKDSTSKFLSLLRNWLAQEDNQSVLRLAIQTFGYYFVAREPTAKDEKDLRLVTSRIVAILDDYATFADDWELINTMMETVPILMDKHESLVLADEELWHAIGKPLASSHPTVKLSSIRLLNKYLDDFYKNTQGSDEAKALTGSQGLRLEKNAVEALVMLAVNTISPTTVARWRKRVAKSGEVSVPELEAVSEMADVDEDLAGEVVQTLARLGKFLEPKPSSDDKAAADENDDGAEENENEGEDEWSGIDEEKPQATSVTLHTLFNFLSDVLVIDTAARASALIPKIAAMQLLSLFITTLPPTTHLVPSLNILLTPLHHLTDPLITIPYSTDPSYKPRVEELQEKARELMETLQKKVGTEMYTRELLDVREGVKRRREGRARKRKIEAVAYPERYGRFKKGKLDKKIKRRKARAGEERERRHGAQY